MRKLLGRAAMATAAGMLAVLAAATPAMADIPFTSGDPARSVVVRIDNLTGCDLNFASEHIFSGMFWNDPSMEGSMGPDWGRSFVIISSESNGFMTGTQADVSYEIGFCPPFSSGWNGLHRLKFAWNDPFVGSNSYSTSGTTSNLHVTRSGGSGDNATVFLTVTLA
jgi:hypothetical protein